MAKTKSHAGKAIKAKVMLIEDHSILRDGLRRVINHDEQFEVVGEAWDMQTTMQVLNQSIPDLAIVDISLANDSGLELIRFLTTNYEGMVILVLSMHDEAIYGERSIKAGARGYVSKSESSAVLLTAMRKVLSGQYYASENLISRVLGRLFERNDKTSTATSFRQLSDRELEVLEFMGLGKSSKQIGESLNLSVKTIHTYQQRLKAKLGLVNMTELLQYATHWTSDLANNRTPV